MNYRVVGFSRGRDPALFNQGFDDYEQASGIAHFWIEETLKAKAVFVEVRGPHRDGSGEVRLWSYELGT